MKPSARTTQEEGCRWVQGLYAAVAVDNLLLEIDSHRSREDHLLRLLGPVGLELVEVVAVGVGPVVVQVEVLQDPFP